YGRSGLCLSLPFLANYGFFVKTQFYRNNCALLKRTARVVFLKFQKTRKKTVGFIRTSRNRMLRFLKRNIGQLKRLMDTARNSVTTIASIALDKITARLSPNWRGNSLVVI
ncbi:hypothetical protein EBR57_06250, partial [bacterium]|nr:hypothetical protein [bacterium]